MLDFPASTCDQVFLRVVWSGWNGWNGWDNDCCQFEVYHVEMLRNFLNILVAAVRLDWILIACYVLSMFNLYGKFKAFSYCLIFLEFNETSNNYLLVFLLLFFYDYMIIKYS